MSSLPDHKRPGLAPPARALAASLALVAAKAAWRSMYPAERDRYVEAPAPKPLSRLIYEAADGWRAAVLHLPAAPGGAGEPVVLTHALGFGTDAFRYGNGPTLASRLSEAGFSVYLLTHRGDREALPPAQRADFSFDDIVEHDLPAALDRVREHSGYAKAHLVGHGLGGQLALAYAGRHAAEGLASVVTLCAAVRFDVPRSEALRAALVAQWLPAHWNLPLAALGPALAPWVGPGRPLFDHVVPGATPSSRLRGVLHHGAEDVPVSLLRQVARWLRDGSLVDSTGLLDYTEALPVARVPLLLAVAAGDRLCPPAAGLAAAERWGGECDTIGLPESYGHLDPLLAADADKRVFGPITSWLSDRRRLAW
jgi:predicted alpha/beta hydrolase